MKKALVVLASASALALAACNTNTTQGPPPAFDVNVAQSMLLTTLQAEMRGDLAATEENLFPRNPQTLAACAKTRIGNARPSSVMGGTENPDGAASGAAEITGVTLSNVHQSGDAYYADVTAQGNSSFTGTSEMFVYANGRWWIKCGI